MKIILYFLYLAHLIYPAEFAKIKKVCFSELLKKFVFRFDILSTDIEFEEIIRRNKKTDKETDCTGASYASHETESRLERESEGGCLV